MNKIRTAGARRPAVVNLGLAAGLAAGWLAIAGLVGLGAATSARASVARRPAILVLPFDLYDFSLDRRPTTVVPLHRWVAGLSAQVATQLRRDASLRVLREADSRAALSKVRVNYFHPTTCRACMISIGKRAGATLVVIGQVHKLSNLITYLDVQVDDVRTGRVVHVINMRADGADTDSMWMNIARNLAGRVAHAAAHAR